MKKKILISTVLVSVITLIIFTLIATNVFYDKLLSSQEPMLRVYSELFDETREADQSYAEELSGAMNGARVTFISFAGTVLADSTGREISENHADRTEVKQALSAHEGFSVRSSTTLGENMIYYCVARTSLLLRIAIPTSSELALFTNCLPTLAWFLALSLVICFLAAYVFVDSFLNPIETMTREASYKKEITAPYPELEPVARIMNHMNDRMDEQIKELEKEKGLVEEAQRSKNEFIANITHEMNTPLTSIHGYAEWLQEKSLAPEMQEKAVTTILKQSDRLTSLVTAIVSYNDLDHAAEAPYLVDATKTAADLLESLSPSIVGRSITLTQDLEPLCLVTSTQERVSTLEGNLIRNAIKYNKEGGTLAVSLKKSGKEILFTVTDTGIGIAPADQPRVFERFFTVDKSHSGKNGGFGLGLAIVKKICNQEGWTVSFSSVLGEGTTFIVSMTSARHS